MASQIIISPQPAKAISVIRRGTKTVESSICPDDGALGCHFFVMSLLALASRVKLERTGN